MEEQLTNARHFDFEKETIRFVDTGGRRGIEASSHGLRRGLRADGWMAGWLDGLFLFSRKKLSLVVLLVLCRGLNGSGMMEGGMEGRNRRARTATQGQQQDPEKTKRAENNNEPSTWRSTHRYATYLR
jgi:hypothetical protein